MKAKYCLWSRVGERSSSSPRTPRKLRLWFHLDLYVSIFRQMSFSWKIIVGVHKQTLTVLRFLCLDEQYDRYRRRTIELELLDWEKHYSSFYLGRRVPRSRDPWRVRFAAMRFRRWFDIKKHPVVKRHGSEWRDECSRDLTTALDIRRKGRLRATLRPIRQLIHTRIHIVV